MSYIKSKNVLIKGIVFTGRELYTNLWIGLTSYWIEYFKTRGYQFRYYSFDTNCSNWNIFAEMYILQIDRSRLKEDLDHFADVVKEVLRVDYPNLRCINPLEDLVIQDDYEYNYDVIKRHKKELHESLVQEIFCPRRVCKWISNGNDACDYLN